MSKFLETLPQYHFDRDEFTKVFYDVFTSDEVFDLIVECQGQRITDEFSYFMTLTSFISFIVKAVQ
jgi:hypothetical protein